ncbi:MAG: hypothetical protein PPP55_09770 [Halorubrum sp.]
MQRDMRIVFVGDDPSLARQIQGLGARDLADLSLTVEQLTPEGFRAATDGESAPSCVILTASMLTGPDLV